MKYSLAVIALLGLSSEVEGVKVQHHHHHKHHFDDFLVELTGDATAAPKNATKAAAPAAAKAAAAPTLAAATKSDPPPENKANTTFKKEEAAGPDKKADYKKPEPPKQKHCEKGNGPMDSFNNCPPSKEELKEAKKPEPVPLKVFDRTLSPAYQAHEAKLEEHFDKSYKGSLDTIQGQKRLEDNQTKIW